MNIVSNIMMFIKKSYFFPVLDPGADAAIAASCLSFSSFGSKSKMNGPETINIFGNTTTTTITITIATNIIRKFSTPWRPAL